MLGQPEKLIAITIGIDDDDDDDADVNVGLFPRGNIQGSTYQGDNIHVSIRGKGKYSPILFKISDSHRPID